MAEMSTAPQIYGAISRVMEEVGAVGKNQRNSQQNFMYRGIDAVMNALNPALIKHKVFIVPEILEEQREERQTKNGANLIYSICKIKYTFFTEDGSRISAVVIGEGMDSGDKATNKAMSIAYKYACFQVFCIPTEEMLDPDAESHEVKKKSTSNKKAAAPPLDLVDEDDIKAMKKELERTGLTEEKICAAFSIKSFKEMTRTQHVACMNKFKVTPDKKGA